MKRYLIPILIGILVLASGLVVSCGQRSQPSVSPMPTPMTTSTALKDYLTEALPIVEEHTNTMDTVYEVIKAIKAIYSHPPKPTGIKQITGEDIASALKAQGTLHSGIHKMENALHKVDSEVVDFSILTPPTEAINYHNLITDSFLKDRAALSDWFYYYASLRERGSGDKEALQRANRHYEEAKELQLQAEDEREALQQKIGR